jgi:hypothetical protein
MGRWTRPRRQLQLLLDGRRCVGGRGADARNILAGPGDRVAGGKAQRRPSQQKAGEGRTHISGIQSGRFRHGCRPLLDATKWMWVRPLGYVRMAGASHPGDGSAYPRDPTRERCGQGWKGLLHLALVPGLERAGDLRWSVAPPQPTIAMRRRGAPKSLIRAARKIAGKSRASAGSTHDGENTFSIRAPVTI